jgi:hypothetical protein
MSGEIMSLDKSTTARSTSSNDEMQYVVENHRCTNELRRAQRHRWDGSGWSNMNKQLAG